MFLKESVLENEIENPIHKTVVPVILCRNLNVHAGLRRQIVQKLDPLEVLRPNTTSLVTILYYCRAHLLLNIKNASAS